MHSEHHVTGTLAVLLPAQKSAWETHVVTVHPQTEPDLAYTHGELVSMHRSHQLLMEYLKSRPMTLLLDSTIM